MPERTTAPRARWGRRCRPEWTATERLASRTRRDPLSGCVLWQGPATASGYGRLRYGERAWLAHRLAWATANGPIPAGAFLCHRCDERRCVNPEHLFLGTNDSNMADLKAKRIRRSDAADSARMHIFIRGLELVADVAVRVLRSAPPHQTDHANDQVKAGIASGKTPNAVPRRAVGRRYVG